MFISFLDLYVIQKEADMQQMDVPTTTTTTKRFVWFGGLHETIQE